MTDPKERMLMLQHATRARQQWELAKDGFPCPAAELTEADCGYRVIQSALGAQGLVQHASESLDSAVEHSLTMASQFGTEVVYVRLTRWPSLVWRMRIAEMSPDVVTQLLAYDGDDVTFLDLGLRRECSISRFIEMGEEGYETSSRTLGEHAE